MLICLNEATKVANLLEVLDKEYLATAKLGETTDTLDAEGAVVRSAGDIASVTEDGLRRVLPRFAGEIEQIPPMYSAIKIDGEPLYRLARKGIEVERKARVVLISELELVAFTPPFFTIRIACSKGTYIRTLCHEIGEALGVGAHVTELTRTRVGEFRIEHAARLDELPDKPGALHSIDSMLGHLPDIRLAGDQLRRALHGNPLPAIVLPRFVEHLDDAVRLKDADGRLFGIGKVRRDSITIERLLHL
jgi:tRNA pseudouridine55 synthase